MYTAINQNPESNKKEYPFSGGRRETLNVIGSPQLLIVEFFALRVLLGTGHDARRSRRERMRSDLSRALMRVWKVFAAARSMRPMVDDDAPPY